MSKFRTFLASAAFIAVSGSAMADSAYVTGVVETIDHEKNLVTYICDESGKAKLASFQEDTKTIVLGKASSVKDLRPGHIVRLKVAPARMAQASL